MQAINMLPTDGEVYYFEGFLDQKTANYYFSSLLNSLTWQQKEIRLFGRSVPQPRLISWNAEPGINYRYSGLTLKPDPWTLELSELKNRVEQIADHQFNSVLANLYRDQNDSQGWHADDEKELGREPVIASLNFGETRDFLLKHRREKNLKIKISLKPGSLLVMRGKTQENWLHALPKRTKNLGQRINLTYRKIIY